MTRQLPLLQAWGPVAYETLRETARTYNAVITHQELAERLEHRTGVTGEGRATTLMSKLLELVAFEAHRIGNPPLTALCVKPDGTIGEHYKRVVTMTTGGTVDDLDQRAALDRWACYREYAADLPPDGGEPALTPQVAKRRERRKATTSARNRDVPQRESSVCTSCFTELALTGQCDNCD